MSNSVVLFKEGQVDAAPDFFAGFDNNDLAGYAIQSYPMISIKGKCFTLNKDGVKTKIMNPKDPESPATWIPMYILKAGMKPSKSFYKEAYREGEQEQKPVCYSFNGEFPDAGSIDKQCHSCAACEHNQWKTSRGLNGESGEGKACSDYIRMACVSIDEKQLETVYYLRVPPASIKPFRAYLKLLNEKHFPLYGAVTKISFDAEAATPKLKFELIGRAEKSTFQKLVALRESDIVNQIVYETQQPSSTGTIPITPVADKEPEYKAPAPAQEGTIQAKQESAADELLNNAFKEQAKKAENIDDAIASLGF